MRSSGNLPPNLDPHPTRPLHGEFSSERWDHAMDEHDQILEALVQRDSGRLKALLAVHLQNKYEVISDWLEQNEKAAEEPPTSRTAGSRDTRTRSAPGPASAVD